MTMPRALLVLVLALLLTACGGGGGSDSGSDGDGSDGGGGSLSDAEIIAAIGDLAPVSQSQLWQQEMLDAINAERDTHGDSSVLSWNDELAAAALYYANDMNDNDAWNHIGTLHDNTLVHRAGAGGYAWNRLGENIAAGQTSVGTVMTAWMNSSGHRANILNVDYTEVGLANVANHWVQVFGRPSGSTKPINQ